MPVQRMKLWMRRCAVVAALAELHAEPVQRNSDLGYYTNFMNMLDYAAVAVPAAPTPPLDAAKLRALFTKPYGTPAPTPEHRHEAVRRTCTGSPAHPVAARDAVLRAAACRARWPVRCRDGRPP